MATRAPDDDTLLLAAEWRARQDAGLSPQEERELQQWLAADPGHAALLQQMDQTWDFMECAEQATPSKLGLSPEVEARMATNRRAPRIPAWSLGLAAAAAIAVTWFVWTTTRPPAPSPDFQQSASVAPGYTKRMDLPDGSIIRLNADSAVRVGYSGTQRSVQLLRGEAHFEVAKNPDRPFTVSARGVAVRAVGTAFNVAFKPDAIEVLVTEGKVTVAPPETTATTARPEATPPLLTAGERMLVSLQTETPPQIAPVAPTEIAQSLAWQERRLDFESAPLSDIIAEFNRFNVHQIVLAPDSASLGQQQFAGSFRADDPATFIKLIRMRSSIVVEQDSAQTVLKLAR